MVQIDASGSEILDEDACLQLLRWASLGRVALTCDALPVILPVAFGVLDGDPIIRAGVGAVWNAGRRGSVLCFEVDDATPDWAGGWSVVVIGRAELTTAADEQAASRRLGLPDWRLDPDGPDGFVRIRRKLISGRRFSRPASVAAPAPVSSNAGVSLGV
jgi:uncharacterized protein